MIGAPFQRLTSVQIAQRRCKGDLHQPRVAGIRNVWFKGGEGACDFVALMRQPTLGGLTGLAEPVFVTDQQCGVGDPVRQPRPDLRPKPLQPGPGQQRCR